jgi:hypothetical protein
MLQHTAVFLYLLGTPQAEVHLGSRIDRFGLMA